MPFVWPVTLLSAGGCLFIMKGLPRQAWERFGIWLAIGLVLYFAYGYSHSRLRSGAAQPPSRPIVSRERGIGLIGAPPAAGSRTWSALVFAIHAAVFAGLLVWSWRKWPDPIIDFGRELYVAWQITEGRVLYRDLATLFGPLSPYVNAFWFRMFGVSLTTLVACNLAIFALLLAGIYRFVGRCADRVTAAAATLSVLFLCGFSQYVEIGNYNFVTPYAHEATHGLAIGIGLLLCLANGVRTGSLRSWAAAGICFGLIVLTKPETAIAALAAVVTAVAGRAVLDRGDARRATGVTLVFFGCASVPPIGFFAYFSPTCLPSRRCARRRARGCSRSGAVSNGALSTFTAWAWIAPRRISCGCWCRSPGSLPSLPPPRSSRGGRRVLADTTMLRRVQQVTLVVAGIGLAQTGMVFAALPLVVASVLIASSVQFWRAPAPSPRRCYQVGELIRQVAESSKERVAVLATGGLSHFPGSPRIGEIDESFDHKLLGGDARGEG